MDFQNRFSGFSHNPSQDADSLCDSVRQLRSLLGEVNEALRQCHSRLGDLEEHVADLEERMETQERGFE